MENEIIKIESISQMHQALGLQKPKHPLISIIDVEKMIPPKEAIGKKIMSGLYSIGLKEGFCDMQYGRNHYDFEEGVLMFTAPNQIMVAKEPSTQKEQQNTGWMLFFHPDLIRKSSLGEHIDTTYSFFSYDVHEALHLSEEEKVTLTDCANKIRDEYNQRIDNHSQRVIVASLDLLLSYCLRFYERQFNTRTNKNKDVVSTVEKTLINYFNMDDLSQKGIPSIQYLADQVHLSSSYLSDLLKKETGRSAKDHINDHIIERAKNMLLGTNETVSEIAYSLGFNYPHYFSRLFKSKIGQSPQSYRDLN